MAPPAKRKRGRPSHASREEVDASGPSTAALTDATNLPPRKRTKRSLEKDGEAANNTEEPVKRSRGRPAAAKTRTNENDENAEAQPAQPKKKRGRPSLQNSGNSEEDSTPAGKPKKKRGRPSLEGREVNDSAPSGTPKKRGRQAKAAEVEGDAQAQEPVKRGRRPKAKEADEAAEPLQRRKKTGRASSQDGEAEGASSRTKKTKSKPATADAGEDEETATPANKTKRVPKRSSRRQSGESQGSQDTTSLYRRRSSLNSAISIDHDPSPPPSPKKPYPHLAPKVRRIRRSLITKKWSPLPASSITLANTLLTLAHRPILQRLSSSSQRLTHTQSALRLLTNRITRRLKNSLPFPPAGAPNITRDMELNFEVVLQKKEKLEGQLDPVVHAVELLKREKGRVERELEQDYRTLRNLEAGISQDRREKGRLLKKAHHLAPGGLRGKREEERDGEVYFEKGKKGATTEGGIFTGIEDEELKDVVMQLSGHVDSMKTNLQQAGGVAEGIERARAAVEEVLLKHLTQEQYEKVVLG